MRSAIGGSVLFVLLCTLPHAYGANWVRSGNGYIVEKEMRDNSPIIFGVLETPPPNSNNCSGDELGGDRVLRFYVEKLYEMVGDSFDVNNVYVDGFGSGEYALSVWLTDWQARGYGRKLPPMYVTNDWGHPYSIYVCVGSLTQAATTDDSLQKIALWYDGPVEKTNESEGYDLRNVIDSLKASRSVLSASDLNGPGTKTVSTMDPFPGLPDFIINDLKLTSVSEQERYIYQDTETIQVHAYAQNIGVANWAGSASDIYIKFYLSNGYKVDAPNERTYIGSEVIQEGNINVGVTKHEIDNLPIPSYYLNPGVYNVVACIDAENEVSEMQESNNCSTEAVFTVAPRPDFNVVQAYFTDRQTQFTPGNVAKFSVLINNAGWNAPSDISITYFLNGCSFVHKLQITVHARYADGQLLNGFLQLGVRGILITFKSTFFEECMVND